MLIRKNAVLLFIGDSITDCGRSQPVGERDGLGNGYVKLVDGLIGAHYPERPVRILNTGIAGNRIIDLEERWERDVLSLKPDCLAIMIGINDVWRQFDAPLDPLQVNIKQFAEVYRRLIRLTRQQLFGLILMTPFYFETNRKDPMRQLMDEYGKAVKKLAVEHNAVLVDVQKGFDEYLKYNPTQSLCGDRVHPNLTGHMIIAKSFLRAIGFRWK